MNFFKQYIKIINYALLGLTFGFACFYILANCYHYLEIRKDYHVDVVNNTLTNSIDDKIANITNNIKGFNANNYRGKVANNKMMVIYHNLNSCVENFNNETYKEVKAKNVINIIDVYKLRESYENDVLSDCILTNLYWIMAVDESFNSRYLLDNNEMIKLHVQSLLDETSYLKKDLLNNSSYFYNTTIASSSMKDNTKDGFYEVIGAYDKAASFVEFVSNWFKNEVEGNYD